MGTNIRLEDLDMEKKNIGKTLGKFFKKYAVPIIFLVLCLVGYVFAEIPFIFLLNEIIIRLARNSFLVLSLIIPVIAGMGLNFGIVLGAMAGQVALIIIANLPIEGIWAFLLAIGISTPIAIVFGYLTGIVLNKAIGKEMITSMILGYFANGLYQLAFLVLAGPIIPIINESLLLSTGIGIKNTIDLSNIRYALDDVIKIKPYPGLSIPIFTMVMVGILCILLTFFFRTKLGQDMRATGQNLHIAKVSGINVGRTRIIATIISTILAAWGQLIFLQNIGTLNTYGSHEQVGLFAVASLLVGGASVTKATFSQALLGTFLFHMLFIISPFAGQNLMNNSQIGEFFRVFVAYGVIGIALALHAWQRKGEL
ncbi:simple sugar transport system permease protein [Proteiniborus ethanoligenes]|uniref:Simple sugar transport system permease protein n=1 Tax=Proteiniborus ethanoligenes TaxID=415015 RepID=A0A1H3NFT8_9FIRM|nr:ABC transporter permease [Proteiniborus ethanoligenes]SDY87738.1 simple sugar transport system permease protein [Proteiniborus ethanoligenes]